MKGLVFSGVLVATAFGAAKTWASPICEFVTPGGGSQGGIASYWCSAAACYRTNLLDDRAVPGRSVLRTRPTSTA